MGRTISNFDSVGFAEGEKRHTFTVHESDLVKGLHLSTRTEFSAMTRLFRVILNVR